MLDIATANIPYGLLKMLPADRQIFRRLVHPAGVLDAEQHGLTADMGNVPLVEP